MRVPTHQFLVNLVEPLKPRIQVEVLRYGLESDLLQGGELLFFIGLILPAIPCKSDLLSEHLLSYIEAKVSQLIVILIRGRRAMAGKTGQDRAEVQQLQLELTKAQLETAKFSAIYDKLKQIHEDYKERTREVSLKSQQHTEEIAQLKQANKQLVAGYER